MLCSHNVLNNANVIGRDLACRVQPATRASASRDNDAAAFELSYVFPIYDELKHARARDVFFRRKNLVKTQFAYFLGPIDLKEGPSPIKSRVAALLNSVHNARHMDCHGFLADLHVQQSSGPTAGVAVHTQNGELIVCN